MKARLSTSLFIGAAGALTASVSTAQISFQAGTANPAAIEPEEVAFGDFDGDGDMDMAATVDGPDRVLVYSNTGNGTFAAPVTAFLASGTSLHSIAAADMDGDGDIDLVITQKDSNTVQVLANQGTGTFVGLGGVPCLGDEPRALTLADIDGDGDLDAVASNRESNNLSIHRNNGGNLGPATLVATGAEPRYVDAGDVNGDGLVDLVLAAHDARLVQVFMNLGGGNFGAATSYSVGAQLRPEGVGLGDLDGDGDLDLVASTSGNGLNFVSVFANTGGVFGGQTNFAVGGVDPGQLVLVDFDGNGDLDVATANNSSANVSVLAGGAGATFGAPTLLAAGGVADGLAAGDVDGNGSADLAATVKNTNTVMVFVNQAAGGGNVGTNYCTSLPNSSGAAASISATGSPVLANNDLVLAASGLPAGQFGYFLTSTTQALVPGFGGSQGILCVGGSIVRFNQNTLVASPAGTVSLAVNNQNLPNQTVWTAGQVWNFQYWTRDLNPSATSNTSNGLTVTFQ